MRTLAIAMCLIATQPTLGAEVVDARRAVMASRLYPALSQLKIKSLSIAGRQILAARRAKIDDCGPDAFCVVRRSLWTDEEIRILARDADQTIAKDAKVRAIANDGVAAQVTRELNGLNYALQVYGLGLPSRNPEIDGPLYKIGATPFATRVSAALDITLASQTGDDLDQSVGLAISLLDVNDRTEAADFEPLEEQENISALNIAGSIDWSKYTYSAILIPGNGPELIEEKLSPRATLRIHLAAERFVDRVAPFIIVSGGAVHPRGTSINEAVEMRRALIDRYGIPAERIILEPYARYTYTNLRNGVRRLAAIGAPQSRKILVITDADHTKTLRNPEFRARGVSTLGYAPGQVEPTSSSTESVFIPSRSSLRVDPLDPLDP